MKEEEIFVDFKLDDIGPWSEQKLEIIQQYCTPYSKILNNKGFRHYYIDGFAGAGLHKSKESGDLILGSPVNAIEINPPFKGYYFIEIENYKINHLKKMIHPKDNIHFHEGDCNKVLLEEVFPLIQYTKYKRAFCLLDPYRLQLKWEIIIAAAKMKTIEILLNFPIMAINRNPLRKDKKKVTEKNIKKMTEFWGDDTWRESLYPEDIQDLFRYQKKATNEYIIDAFRDRLKKIAGFKYVPKPIPMKNTIGRVVYYLFFASHNETGSKIMNSIFTKYR